MVRRTAKAKGARKRRAPRKPKPAKAPTGGAVVTAVKPASLVKLLKKTRAGKDFTRATLKAEVKAGFKPNADGTIDLVRFVAWLLKRHGYGEGGFDER